MTNASPTRARPASYPALSDSISQQRSGDCYSLVSLQGPDEAINGTLGKLDIVGQYEMEGELSDQPMRPSLVGRGSVSEILRKDHRRNQQ